MAKIKMKYKTRDELPKGMEELYDEVDGDFVLTGVEGLKTQEDITRVQQSLVNERKDHKATKDKLNSIASAVGDMSPEALTAKLDLVEELQAQVDANKNGKGDEAIDRIVETRLKRAMAPVERERDMLKKQVGDLSTEREQLSTTIKTGRIEDAVRKVAFDQKIVNTAMDDVLLNAGRMFELDEAGRVVTRDNIDGVSPGITPDVWLKDMQDRRPHWWPTTQGGGAHGSGAHGKGMSGNPWAPGNWNMTEQGKYVQLHGMEKASQLAAQAGTTIGGKPKAA